MEVIMGQASHEALLEIKNLIIHYETDNGVVEAVNNVSLSLNHGETLGLVGETGAGKTTTALGILQIIPNPPGRMVGGEVIFNGKTLNSLNANEMRKIRGKEISMIFQDPMTSLNPVIPVGDQIAEVVRLHGHVSLAEANIRAKEMLEKVGINAERYNEYPHQFSGGMKQRVVSAIALACNPKLIIADEPTTALDVTIQAQVLDMMKRLKDDFNTSMLLITHDLGVVAETCDNVAIMYAGEIVEIGTKAHIFKNTCHPYTKGLFDSLPRLDVEVDRLLPIRGLVPDPMNLPSYCSFYDRCDKRTPHCKEVDPAPVEVEPGHFVKCLLCSKGGNKK
jgi:peptide/nickel transport system ATP-binding protein